MHFFYFNDTLEIIILGRDHEFFKSIIGMLISLVCLACEIKVEPLGLMTQENERSAIATKPDQSYVFGVGKSTPDSVIEVVLPVVGRVH